MALILVSYLFAVGVALLPAVLVLCSELTFNRINVCGIKHCIVQVEDIEYIEVKQFQDAEKWCIKHINLTFNGTTKQYGETGWIENVIKNSTAMCLRRVVN